MICIHTSPDIIKCGDRIKESELGEESSTNGRDEKCVKNFSRKREEKRPLGTPRRKTE
jgi:hypothetical protein